MGRSGGESICNEITWMCNRDGADRRGRRGVNMGTNGVG